MKYGPISQEYNNFFIHVALLSIINLRNQECLQDVR